MKLTSLIIEDDAMQAASLKKMVEAVCPEISVLDICFTVPQAEVAIRKMKPQFVFRHYDGAFTGFDLLNRFDEIDFEVIFTTTYQDFAYKAIKISAVDFLLKPFGEEEIKLAVKKLKERITSKQTLEYLNLLKQNIQKKPEAMQVAIPVLTGYRFVEVSQILYVESSGKFNQVFLINGDDFVSTITLSEIEKMVSDIMFFRSAKHIIVNLSYVNEYLKNQEKIILKNGKSVPLSRLRKSMFLAAVSRYQNS
ncbi:MAG: response regulator transcription factor [Bacteroidota bacterium]|nr:MAG: response regulator transcription factor [Bacteroidota bacterium]